MFKLLNVFSLVTPILVEGQIFQRDAFPDFESAPQNSEIPQSILVQSVKLSDVYGSSKVASYSVQKGKWDPSGKSGVVCIHMALLPDSRLLCFERPHQGPVSCAFKIIIRLSYGAYSHLHMFCT